MARRNIIFDVSSLWDLMVHYNCGRDLPLYAEVKEVAVSRFMDRMICLVVEAKEWGADAGDVSPVTGELKPLEFLYEGRHNVTFTSGQGQAKLDWRETPEP